MACREGGVSRVSRGCGVGGQEAGRWGVKDLRDGLGDRRPGPGFRLRLRRRRRRFRHCLLRSRGRRWRLGLLGRFRSRRGWRRRFRDRLYRGRSRRRDGRHRQGDWRGRRWSRRWRRWLGRFIPRRGRNLRPLFRCGGGGGALRLVLAGARQARFENHRDRVGAACFLVRRRHHQQQDGQQQQMQQPGARQAAFDPNPRKDPYSSRAGFADIQALIRPGSENGHVPLGSGQLGSGWDWTRYRLAAFAVHATRTTGGRHVRQPFRSFGIPPCCA